MARTIDIIIPSGREMSYEVRDNLAASLQEINCRCGDHAPWDCTRGKWSVFVVPSVRSSVVHWVRNSLVGHALWGPHPPERPPAEWIFLMDDDMLGDPLWIPRLLSHKKDIVGGICTVRRDPPEPTIRFWNSETGSFQRPIEWDWNSVKLIEVDGNGMAYCLVRRRVFEQMADAFLNCFFERELDKFRGMSNNPYWDNISALRKARHDKARADGDFNGANCWWFDFMKAEDLGACLPNKAGYSHGEVGEDLSFCARAKKLGFRIFADPQVQPGHLGAYSYSLQDYIAYVDAQKQVGRLPETLPVNVHREELVEAK